MVPALCLNADTKLELVDVTKYEAGSLADQSTLLNLLSDTDIVNMTTHDLQLFSKASFVADWMRLKVKQNVPRYNILPDHRHCYHSSHSTDVIFR